jgi:hypothetical protein
MRKLLLSTVFTLIVTSPAFATCTARGNVYSGQTLIGYDYVVDGNFSQGCSNWSYTNVTRQSQAGGLCGVFSNTYAKFAEALGLDKVVQVVYIPNPGETGYFSSSTSWTVSFTNDASGTGTSSDYVQVRLYDDDTNQSIYLGPSILGTQAPCVSAQYNITRNLNGKNVRIEIRGAAAGSFYWKISDVGLLQAP